MNFLIRSMKREKEQNSNVGMWHQPQRSGYTSDINHAGIFNLSEAMKAVQTGTPDGNMYVEFNSVKSLAKPDGTVSITDLEKLHERLKQQSA